MKTKKDYALNMVFTGRLGLLVILLRLTIADTATSFKDMIMHNYGTPICSMGISGENPCRGCSLSDLRLNDSVEAQNGILLNLKFYDPLLNG